MMIAIRRLLAGLACVIGVGICGNGLAQVFPSRPITLVVPFPAGGPTDVIARTVAERMRDSLGQPIVVENVVGASGSLGVGRVARANPDGYTLSFGTWSTHVVNGATMSLPYHVRNDFEPVALVAHSPMVLVATKSVPGVNLRAFVAWLSANPDKASAGTAGIAGANHLAGVLFRQMTGTHFQLVPYRGVGPAMQDLIAGRIDFMFDLVPNSMPQVRAGSIKAHAVLAKSRLNSLPDIPTVEEGGVAGLHVSSWQAIWAPKGTPKSVVDKVNAAALYALADPATRGLLSEMSQEVPPREEQSADALGALQDAEIAKWWPLIKAAGIKAE